MKSLTLLPRYRCLFFHRWLVDHDTGAVRYLECKSCGGKKIEDYSQGYQPVDMDWLTIDNNQVIQPRALKKLLMLIAFCFFCMFPGYYILSKFGVGVFSVMPLFLGGSLYGYYVNTKQQ